MVASTEVRVKPLLDSEYEANELCGSKAILSYPVERHFAMLKPLRPWE